MQINIGSYFKYGVSDYSAFVAGLDTNLEQDSFGVVDVYSPDGVTLLMTGIKLIGLSVIKFKRAELFGKQVKMIARVFDLDGAYWVDNFVLQDGTLNIEFKSQGEDSGSGEDKTFAGTLTQDGQPVSRSVYALAIDGDKPKLLSHATSDAAGNYLLKWKGYTGQIMVMATDEYGSLFKTNETLSVGSRLHPAQPNGYVYEVTQAGITDGEPSWTAQEGAVVLSGGVQLTAKPYYRGKTAGPFTIT